MRHHYYFFFFLLNVVSFAVTAQSSLEFVENRGQWDGPFVYKSISRNSDIYLEKNGFTFVVGASQNPELIHAFKHNEIKIPPVLKFHAYKIILEGASENTEIIGSKKQQHYYNYFLGNDPDRWKSNIHPCLNVDYKNVYPGIDLHLASERTNLKYDFIVSPGANSELIRLTYEGDEGIRLRKNNLEVKTSIGTITELEPYAYQYINGEKIEVPCKYLVKGKTVSYYFPRDYDHTKTLVIDPTVVFSTFTGSFSDNWGFTATYDNQGNFYAGGIANGNSFPTTIGAFQVTFGGGGLGGGNITGNPPQPIFPSDIVVSKINSTGTAFIYSTYIGGSNNDQPHSLIVDANNNIIIAGRTYSGNFPVTANAYDATYNGFADTSSDIVVVKLNSTGTALVGSTYIGGAKDDGVNISSLWGVTGGLKHSYSDDARSEVIVDNTGNVYIAASTQSSDFPVTGNAFQSTLQGNQDAVVFKLNSALSNLIWSTYIGGNSNDAAYVLALNQTESSLFVSGGTQSSNFPSTPGTVYPNYQGGNADGFILKFQNGGTYALQRGTFIGTNSYDQSFGVQVDRNNRVYAMGQTLGGNFPVTAGVYSNPGSSQFIIKLDSNLSNTIYSTVFGSGNSVTTNISPVAFLVDTCEQVYISGWGGTVSQNGGNTLNMPITSNAVQSSTDGNDFYFIVLSKNASALLYGSYYGSAVQSSGEHVDGGTSRFDKNGVVYQGICAGCGGSSAFPTTPGVISNTNNSPNCNYAALKIAFEFILRADAVAFPDTSGCAPLTVSFNNNSLYASSYLWDFGDGSPLDTSTTPPSHTYTNPGTYIVKLMAFNSNACNQLRDTDYIKIVVDSNFIKTNFDFTVLDTCKKPIQVSFTNTSQYNSTPGAPGITQFIWNFGDGTTFTGANPPIHNYQDTGSYKVTLLMIDTTACNKRDSIIKVINVFNRFIQADFEADSGCIGKPTEFFNYSTNSSIMFWSFGDGNTSGAFSPQHVYQNSGIYTVTLIASNPNSCNKLDTISKTIEIYVTPTADFNYAPFPAELNMPVKFTNKSKNAVRYIWGFGDGTGSTEEHPEHFYKKTGTYLACLTAYSEHNCPDTRCKKVDAIVEPIVDVPTGFSPNGDGMNDILVVRGGAIEYINFRIFNRFGEKIFEVNNVPANDPKYGWDGTYKGEPQEMEAYAWVLEATFIDGSSVTKQGNVTLLR